MNLDLRVALRHLTTCPLRALALTFIFAGSLAVTAAVFSIVDGLLLRPLPLPASSQLVHVDIPADLSRRLGREERDRLRDRLASTPAFRSRANYRAALIFEQGSAAMATWKLVATHITPDFLDTLGVAPVRGRGFTQDDSKGDVVSGLYSNAPVAIPTIVPMIISHDLWIGMFGQREEVIGTVVDFPGVIFGSPARIVGIMPEGFGFPGGTNVWIPWQGSNRSVRLGRLAPDHNIEQLQAEFPGVEVMSLRNYVRPGEGAALVTVLVAMGALLVVAWMQVAALLFGGILSSGVALGTRYALGATRLHLARLVVTEAVLLSCMSCLLAVVATPSVVTAIAELLPAALTAGQWVEPNWRVWTFAGLVAAIGAAAIAAFPVILITRMSPMDLFRGSGSLGARRSRFILLTTQVAMTAVLVQGTVLLVKSYRMISAVDVGFSASELVGFELPPVDTRGNSRSERGLTMAAHADLVAATLSRLSSIQGVEHVAGGPIPFATGQLAEALLQEVKDAQGGFLVEAARFEQVTFDYGKAIGLTLVAGHWPDRHLLLTGDSRAAVVNEAFEQAAGVPVVGRIISVGSRRLRVSGVVADFSLDSPGTVPPPLVLSVGEPWLDMSRIVLRLSDAQGPTTISGLAVVLEDVWGKRSRRHLLRVSDAFGEAVADFRARAIILGLIALFTLTLAFAGVAGAGAASAQEQGREIAIRAALGASPTAAATPVIIPVAAATGLGVAIAFGLGFVLSGTLEGLLFATAPTDTVALLMPAVLLLGAAVFAGGAAGQRVYRNSVLPRLRER